MNHFETALMVAKQAQSPLLKVIKFFMQPGDGSITAFGKIVKETMTAEEIADLALLIDQA